MNQSCAGWLIPYYDAHEVTLGYYRLSCNRNNSWLGLDTDDERQSLAAGDWVSRVRGRFWEDRLPAQEIALTLQSRVAALNLQLFCAINRAAPGESPRRSPATPRRLRSPRHSHARIRGLAVQHFSPRLKRGF